MRISLEWALEVDLLQKLTGLAHEFPVKAKVKERIRKESHVFVLHIGYSNDSLRWGRLVTR